MHARGAWRVMHDGRDVCNKYNAMCATCLRLRKEERTLGGLLRKRTFA